MKDKIALSMICGDSEKEAERLDIALSSIYKYVDAIFITLNGDKDKLDKVKKVCKKYKAEVSYGSFLWTCDKKAVNFLKKFFGYKPKLKPGDTVFQFDEARNYNLDQIPKDKYKWVLWMDTDDVFVGGEDLWKVIDIGDQADIDAFFLNYIYQAEFDDEGNVKNVVIEHLRERIIKNNGVYKWVMPIHETLIEQKPTRKTDNYDCYVLHTSEMEDRVISLRRNLKNLELAIYKTEGKDPRQIYYLAKAYFDLGTMEYYDKCIPLIELYLHGENKSGWAEERSQAWEYLTEIYRFKKQYNKSIKASLNAMVENQPGPSPFLNMALTYMMKNEWETSLFWVKIASTIADRKSTLVRNPRDLQARTLEVIYQCSLNLGKINEAWAAMVKLKELFPDVDYVKNNYEFISNLKQQRDITQSVVSLAEYLKQTGEIHKIRPLLQGVPKIAEDTPFVIDLINKNFPAKFWSEDEIVIYCGPGFTNWSPKKITNPGESFIGGSEEAVIRMSKELSRLDWKVTVYADPGQDEGEYDGVNWLPYYKFNKKDKFNIVIAWRNIGITDWDLKFKKLYIWNHDIQNTLDWNKERIDKITKAMFLSKWHRDNVPDIPEDKVFLTSNGL